MPAKQELVCPVRLRTSAGEVLGKSAGSPDPVCSTITRLLGDPQENRTSQRGEATRATRRLGWLPVRLWQLTRHNSLPPPIL